MACPFFMPTTKLEDGGWLHPSRLPLGGGWHGQCSAPGHEGAAPAIEELREACNLGYAQHCPRLPKARSADAIRFGVSRDTGIRLLLSVVYESNHRPAGQATLEFDLACNRWISTHPDPRIQRMAECYLESYQLRRGRPVAENVNSRTHS